MAGDGVSLPTNLAQMGTVAKAQARGQQSGVNTTVAHELQKKDVKPLQKVREAEKADQKAVDPDQQQSRQRNPDDEDEKHQPGDPEQDESNAQPPVDVGGLVDTKA